MLAVDIGVGHQDDLVVAQAIDVELVLDTGAKGRHERLYLSVLQHLVDACLLDVQNLAADRQDRLTLGVSTLSSGSTSGVTLDNEDLTLLRLTTGAVNEFAGHAGATQKALAVACEVTRLACSNSRCGGVD